MSALLGARRVSESVWGPHSAGEEAYSVPSTIKVKVPVNRVVFGDARTVGSRELARGEG